MTLCPKLVERVVLTIVFAQIQDALLPRAEYTRLSSIYER